MSLTRSWVGGGSLGQMFKDGGPTTCRLQELGRLGKEFLVLEFFIQHRSALR